MYIFIQGSSFQIVIWEMAAILLGLNVLNGSLYLSHKCGKRVPFLIQNLKILFFCCRAIDGP